MAKPTVAQLEARVTAHDGNFDIIAETFSAMREQIARLEQQLALLQLAEKPQADVAEYDPCKRVENWGMEYKRYRHATGKSPTADGVREWIRAGRPGA